MSLGHLQSAADFEKVTWRLDLLLLDFAAKYEEMSTTALSDNPDVAVPLLTINRWILMQRKVTGGSVSFNQNWSKYRDGFGSATDNDNYWLGLEKIYRLLQLGNLRLRIEAINHDLLYIVSVCVSTEASFYIYDMCNCERLCVEFGDKMFDICCFKAMTFTTRMWANAQRDGRPAEYR